MNKKNIILLTFLLLFPLITFAQNDSAIVGLGQIAANITEPVSLLANVVHSACYIIGGSFIFTGIIKWVEHRRSPLMVPISTVIFLFVAGVILILLPLLAYYSGVDATFNF